MKWKSKWKTDNRKPKGDAGTDESKESSRRKKGCSFGWQKGKKVEREMKESKKSRTNNLNLWIILWESINEGKRRKRKEMKRWPFEAFPGITILLSCLQLCKIVGSKSRYLTVFSCSSSMGKKKKYIGRCLWKRRKDISSDSLQSQEMSLINLLLIWFFKPGTSRLDYKASIQRPQYLTSN